MRTEVTEGRRERVRELLRDILYREGRRAEHGGLAEQGGLAGAGEPGWTWATHAAMAEVVWERRRTTGEVGVVGQGGRGWVGRFF